MVVFHGGYFNYANINTMLTFEQMFVRFAIALMLGALLGLERELVGEKSARDGSVKMKLVAVLGLGLTAARICKGFQALPSTSF